jgi:hypothetical protein
MDRSTREFVIKRAGGRCEYCSLRQEQAAHLTFQIEHIRAKQHHGGDTLDNLCVACPYCNFAKGANQSAYDPLTNELVRLFNPRKDAWDAHFKLERGWVIGNTPEGRATVALLRMNRDQVVFLRQTVIGDESLP